jgi:hypothetical protein
MLQQRTGKRVSKASWAVSAALTAGLALGTATPAFAAPSKTFDLPAGTACSFPLTVTQSGGDHRVDKTFTDKNGNVVRQLSAGKGFKLTFRNGTTGRTVTLPANGSVTHTTVNPDDTTTVTLTGHNVLILFPTDVPAGPTTTLYVGRVVFTVDANGVFTLQSTSGRKTDLCAQLV